jgi:hypothetical protein
LAAILAVDVAGYSRLMGEDEEGTVAALRAVRRGGRPCPARWRSIRPTLRPEPWSAGAGDCSGCPPQAAAVYEKLHADVTSLGGWWASSSELAEPDVGGGR